MIVSIDIDAQKTFTPLCPHELPIAEGHLIAPELNAQAKLANKRVMTKDAHTLAAKWLCTQPHEMLQPTGLPDAPEKWLPHAIIGTQGFELLDDLPDETEYDFCIWKGVSPTLHPYGACFHDVRERLSTGLIEWLTAQQTQVVLVGGLATDYCVQSTVLQLLRGGNWQVWVNRAACRGISAQRTEQAWQTMQTAGALILNDAHHIAQHLKTFQAAFSYATKTA